MKNRQQPGCDVVIKGEPARERVTITSKEEVRFERIESAGEGTIRNLVEEDATGALWLRFTFDLYLPGYPRGAPCTR